MKSIISIYGRYLLEAMVLVGLMLLLFTRIQDNAGNLGVYQIIGARLTSNAQNINYDDYADFDEMITDSTRSKPVISYTGSNSIHVGHIVLSDYINAMDYNGSVLPIKVLEVVDPAGAEISSNQYTEIDCTTPGVYTVTVSAVDDICKKTICTIRIPIS